MIGYAAFLYFYTLFDITSKERLYQILEDTRKRGKKTAETVQQQIEDRILISLIAATGVGLLLGIILSWIIRGRDSD